MIKSVNIVKILRVLVILIPVVFMLASCAGKEDETESRGAIGSDENTDEIAAKHDEGINCWQRHVVGQLYDTMGIAAMGMYTKITNGALTVMLLAWAIWFMIRMMKHVSSVMEENPAEVWTEVFKKLFVCFACGVMASTPAAVLFFLNTFIFPVYNAMLEFGSRILTAAHAESMEAIINVGGKTMNWGDMPMSACRLSGNRTATLSGFPSGPKEMMSCLICSTNQRMNMGYALAFKVMQADGLLMPLVVGGFILACFTIVKLGFVFHLVDTIFKFTMMVIILPLLIMGYAFPKTKGWFSTAVKQMLNSAAFMTFIAMMIAVAFMAISQIIAQNPEIFADSDVDTYKELSIPFMCLTLVCFLIVSTLNGAQKLAGSLVGGDASSEFSKKIVVIAKMVAGWITGGLSKLVGKIAVVKKVKAKKDAIMGKLNSLAGRDKD